MEYVTVGISVLALIISGLTLWLTQFKKAKLRMTKPTVIYFGADGGASEQPKIFLRTLLYATASRGVVLEHLFVKVHRNETQQSFNIWVYGDRNLTRGSGIYVGPQGLATNHHFLLPNDETTFKFEAGEYRLEVFSKVVGDNETSLLHCASLSIDVHEAEKLGADESGIYFDWSPSSGKYLKKIDSRKRRTTSPLDLLDTLQNGDAIS